MPSAAYLVMVTEVVLSALAVNVVSAVTASMIEIANSLVDRARPLFMVDPM